VLLVPSEQATAASNKTEQPNLETHRIIMILPSADDPCRVQGICQAKHSGIFASQIQPSLDGSQIFAGTVEGSGGPSDEMQPAGSQRRLN
jgi:hypothetical protein